MKISPAKRFLILGLSFLVMLNSAGFFVLTYVQTGLHRAVEYSGESEKSPELLSLTAKEFKTIVWIGTRDFIFDGNVYDCEGVYAANGKINLQCHADAEETNLKNSLANNFEDGSKNVPASKPIKDFFKVFPVFQSLTETTDITFQANSSFQYAHYSKQSLSSADLPLNSPPPKFS